MKYLIIYATIFTMVLCRPENTVHVTQDTDGNYDIEYNLEDSFRKEVKQNGVVYGSYSYIDNNGVVQTVQYSAGPKTGFIILDSSNHLPSAVSVSVLPVLYARDVATIGAKHSEILQNLLKKSVENSNK